MKKPLFLLIATAALIFSSCSSKSEPFYTMYGSLENFMSVSYTIGPRGETYEIGPGSTYPFPAVPEGLDRSRFLFGFNLVDESSNIATDKNIPIKLSYYEILPTQTPEIVGSVDYNDPILVLNGQPDRIYTDLAGAPSGITTMQNYLDMMIYHYLYTKNKDSGEDFAIPSVTVEVDPEIEEATGSGNDIIHMYLRFDNNRHKDENISYQLSYYILSIDVQNMASQYGFPSDATYTIKMHYKAYADISASDDDELVEKTVTVDWNPSKPYASSN